MIGSIRRRNRIKLSKREIEEKAIQFRPHRVASRFYSRACMSNLIHDCVHLQVTYALQTNLVYNPEQERDTDDEQYFLREKEGRERERDR